MTLKFCMVSFKSILLLSLIPMALSNCVAPDQMSPAASSQAATSMPGQFPWHCLSRNRSCVGRTPRDDAVMGTPGFWVLSSSTRTNRSGRPPGGGNPKSYPLRAGKDRAIKVGWFRPAGETLEITGRRLDGHSPPLESHIPCCYPTRFQSSGLYFPGEGCWEITATAGESVLSFIVRVEP